MFVLKSAFGASNFFAPDSEDFVFGPSTQIDPDIDIEIDATAPAAFPAFDTSATGGSDPFVGSASASFGGWASGNGFSSVSGSAVAGVGADGGAFWSASGSATGDTTVFAFDGFLF